MKKVLCVIVVIGFLLVGLQPVAAETYTFYMTPFVAWSPYKVAEMKGFWKRQGVSVELVSYAFLSEAKEGAHQKRRVDFVHMPLANIAEPQKDGMFDVVYLGTLSIANRHKYLIIKNDLVNKPLKGQTIGTFIADSAGPFLLSSYLKTVNTSLADVRLVVMSPDELEANFLHNRLQAVLTVDRGNKFYEQANGMIAASTQDFYEPHGLAFFKEGGLAAIPPEDLKKILRGCVEAIMWLRDPANWEEYKAILKQSVLVGMPDLPDEQIREMTKEMTFVKPQTLLEHNQQKLREHFAEFRAFLAAEGSLEEDMLKDFTYDNVINNQALIEVLQEYVE